MLWYKDCWLASVNDALSKKEMKTWLENNDMWDFNYMTPGTFYAVRRSCIRSLNDKGKTLSVLISVAIQNPSFTELKVLRKLTFAPENTEVFQEME